MSASNPPAVRVELLPLSEITPNPRQVRREFDAGQLLQLADSIRANGVIQPIVVRPTPPDTDGTLHLVPWQIIAGERRWCASCIAGLDHIPAVIRTDLSDADAAVLQVLENLQRADLTLPELSSGVAKLVDAIGFPAVCAQLGKSPAWISKHSRIQQLDQTVKDLVTSGKVTSADLAHDLARIQELSQQLPGSDSYYFNTAVRRVEEGSLTRQAARDTVQRIQADLTRHEKQKQQCEARRNDDAQQAEQHEAQEKARLARREQLTNAIKSLRDSVPLYFRPLAEALITQLQLEPRVPRDGDGFPTVFNTHESPILIDCDLAAAYWSDDPLPSSIEACPCTIELKLQPAELARLFALLGVGPTDSARQANADADADADADHETHVARFISQRIERAAGARLKAADAYAAYSAWCVKNGCTPLAINDNAYGEAWAAAGVAKVRSNGIRYLHVELRA